MADETLSNYLRDLGVLLKEDALDAKQQASSEVGGPGHQFALGRLTAYYEVLSLLRQQADAFGIEVSKISLDGFDPDRDLLADRLNPGS